MSLQEKIKNGTTELQEFYEIASKEVQKRKTNITKLNKELKEEQEKLFKAWDLQRRCEIRAEEQGYYNLFKKS